MDAKKVAAYADELGHIKAELAYLKDRENEIKATLLRAKVRRGEGMWYRFTLSHSISRRVKWAAVAKALKPSRQLVTAHTSTVESDTLHVMARTGEETKAA